MVEGVQGGVGKVWEGLERNQVVHFLLAINIVQEYGSAEPELRGASGIEDVTADSGEHLELDNNVSKALI